MLQGEKRGFRQTLDTSRSRWREHRSLPGNSIQGATL